MALCMMFLGVMGKVTLIKDKDAAGQRIVPFAPPEQTNETV
jgi:hypothetical protein